ncbi:MAG: hypothetical protein EP347_12120 [Alphaproteobacteria bacterium]|nr:MAG: hypothetical protein EP347_12120 [Alphaproteobacteria bacterium]
MALCLLALAFAVRSLVPTGFMPDQSDEAGFLTVQICDAYGGGRVTYDLKSGQIVNSETEEGGSSTPSGHPDHTSTCPFAAGALFEGAQAIAGVEITSFRSPLRAGRPAYSLALEAASRAPLPPRGPPTHV